MLDTSFISKNKSKLDLAVSNFVNAIDSQKLNSKRQQPQYKYILPVYNYNGRDLIVTNKLIGIILGNPKPSHYTIINKEEIETIQSFMKSKMAEIIDSSIQILQSDHDIRIDNIAIVDLAKYDIFGLLIKSQDRDNFLDLSARKNEVIVDIENDIGIIEIDDLLNILKNMRQSKGVKFDKIENVPQTSKTSPTTIPSSIANILEPEPMLDVELLFCLSRKKFQAVHVQLIPTDIFKKTKETKTEIKPEIAAVKICPVYSAGKLIRFIAKIEQRKDSTNEIKFNRNKPPLLKPAEKSGFDWELEVECVSGRDDTHVEVKLENMNIGLMEHKDKLDVTFKTFKAQGMGAPGGICRVVIYE